MKHENKLSAINLIDAMYAECNTLMHEYFEEYIDHCTNDEHLLMLINRERDLHDQLIQLTNFINDEV